MPTDIQKQVTLQEISDKNHLLLQQQNALSSLMAQRLIDEIEKLKVLAAGNPILLEECNLLQEDLRKNAKEGPVLESYGNLPGAHAKVLGRLVTLLLLFLKDRQIFTSQEKAAKAQQIITNCIHIMGKTIPQALAEHIVLVPENKLSARISAASSGTGKKMVPGIDIGGKYNELAEQFAKEPTPQGAKQLEKYVKTYVKLFEPGDEKKVLELLQVKSPEEQSRDYLARIAEVEKQKAALNGKGLLALLKKYTSDGLNKTEEQLHYVNEGKKVTGKLKKDLQKTVRDNKDTTLGKQAQYEEHGAYYNRKP